MPSRPASPMYAARAGDRPVRADRDRIGRDALLLAAAGTREREQCRRSGEQPLHGFLLGRVPALRKTDSALRIGAAAGRVSSRAAPRLPCCDALARRRVRAVPLTDPAAQFSDLRDVPVARQHRRSAPPRTTRSIKTATKNPDRVRERRDRLINAAIAVFVEKGFHNATVRDIGRVAEHDAGDDLQLRQLEGRHPVPGVRPDRRRVQRGDASGARHHARPRRARPLGRTRDLRGDDAAPARDPPHLPGQPPARRRARGG